MRTRAYFQGSKASRSRSFLVQARFLPSQENVDRSLPSIAPQSSHRFGQISVGTSGSLIQPKLTIGQPNDQYEQEADLVANQVMRMPESDLSEQEETIQTKPMLLRSQDSSQQVETDLEQQLRDRQGKGTPLSEDVQRFMESRFHTDFSQVRVHTDGEAAQMNRSLNAQAFTHQQDIYFGAGKVPGKDALTAHELTHVMQQTGTVQRQISTPLPAGVVPNRRTGRAVFTHGGVQITILPDGRQQKAGAETTIDYNWGTIRFRASNGVVTSFTGPGIPRATIQTRYGPGLSSSATSGYGRGTTAADTASGDTSLGFHEGSHGTDYLDFFAANPIPQFTGTVGMSERDFRDAMTQYQNDCQQYSQNLEAFSLRRTDCVGTTIDQYNATQGRITALCTP